MSDETPDTVTGEEADSCSWRATETVLGIDAGTDMTEVGAEPGPEPGEPPSTEAERDRLNRLAAALRRAKSNASH